MLENFKTHPKTTIAGSLILVAAIITGAVVPLLQGNPIDWTPILAGLAALGLGGVAKDPNSPTLTVLLLCGLVAIGAGGCAMNYPMDHTLTYAPDGKTVMTDVQTVNIAAMQAMAKIQNDQLAAWTQAGTTFAQVAMTAGTSIETMLATLQAQQQAATDARNLAFLDAALAELNKLAGAK
jgi:hypothetical protein